MTASAAPMLASLLPRPTPADPLELAAMQRARLRSSVAWLLAGVVGAQFAGLAFPFGGTAGRWVVFGLVAAVALSMLAAGFAQLVLLAWAQPRRAPQVAGIAVGAALGALLAPVAGLLSFAFGLVHLAGPVAALAFGIMLLGFDPRMRSAMPRPWLGVLAGLGTGIVALAVGAIDGAALLPLAMVPGVPLHEIYALLVAAGEDGGVWVPLIWAALWAVALVTLALGLLRNRRSQRGALGVLVAAVAGALLALPVTQFSMGMSLGDTVVTQGSHVSPAYPAILLAGALLAALAAGLLIGARQR
ncbi:hypothetical protein [Agrococcus sp. ARC_14]|uniref:hypothetical protein n=1 Tax=Agrococcus sp. ARC_14 TaxID=2919927 RepID=UPI001F063699|nr:hypothetical protein [Agrococcus sp. ARC_14]MCH1881649.1 hypothetical protein [Agrococcus sp. ARC_14]